MEGTDGTSVGSAFENYANQETIHGQMEQSEPKLTDIFHNDQVGIPEPDSSCVALYASPEWLIGWKPITANRSLFV